MSAPVMERPKLRRRGRPRKEVLRSDYGTPELMAKKMRGETAEAIDLCLQRRLITEVQHWSGMHLRWLYTLRYGVPTVRAVDPAHLGGIEPKATDVEWYMLREKEFSEAVCLLASHGCAKLVASVCIYNEYPLFLKPVRSLTTGSARQSSELIGTFRNGLELLAGHWKK